MCFVDPAYASILAENVSRRCFLGAGLTAGLAASATDWAQSLLLPGLAEGSETPGKSGGPGGTGVFHTTAGKCPPCVKRRSCWAGAAGGRRLPLRAMRPACFSRAGVMRAQRGVRPYAISRKRGCG